MTKKGPNNNSGKNFLPRADGTSSSRWWLITPMILVFALILPGALLIPPVAAQASGSVAAQPAFTNLGLTTSIVVNAPAAGEYAVIITKPDGKSQSQLGYSFTQPGDAKQLYGNGTLGFAAIIDQIGTYRVSLQSQGRQIAESTFFATDKLILELTVANAGTTDNVCYLSNEFTRGTSIIPRIYVQYASTGEYVTPANSPNATVTFTLPNGTKMETRFAPYLPPQGAYRNCFRPTWNDYAGPWNIVAEAADGKGNTGRFESHPAVVVGGRALRFGFEILPAPLTITSQVIDTATGKPASSALSSGQSLRIEARVEYRHPLGPLGRESADGYLGLLNATRGGTVSARLGWGFYNETAKAFGAGAPGGLIATIPLSYDQSSGFWIGTYPVTGSEPKGDYQVIIDASDSANPANTGTIKAVLSPPPEVIERTVERTITNTIEKTLTSTVEKPVEKLVEVIPGWAYGAMVGLLVVGAVVGVTIGRKRR